MRTMLPCLAPFIVVLASSSFGQSPADKNKAAATPQTQTAPDVKPAEQPADKPSAPKFGVPTDSEKLLDQAIAKVESIKKFHAQVRQKTEMLGYTFTAEGQYAVAPDFHVLFELKVQLTNDTTGSLKEVCDGRTHWRNQKVLDTQELVKMDVKRLRDVFEKSQFDKEVRDQLLRQLGFSGMVPLMKGLRETQKFDSHDEEMLDGTPVYVLHGQWREEVISQTSFRGQQLNLARMPYVPSKSTAWIGRDDGWLHKLELEGAKKVQGSVTKITLEFLEPRIDVDLPESLFAFEPPPGVTAEDQTELMYQRLNIILQRGQGPERRPAGAATSDGSPADASKSKGPSANIPPSKATP